ncbi:hypothetical protein ASPTUDRAFT_336122 [Aspergillus tubingensis CBS 134.48]|uniref:Uncharacterized protein n=1 Tax=Aspergillus tubingensis (strain CBS 134.48) TaxID=767770 RepID=A0A1L9NKG1_ASPTC|nr:hypothetical protein ASPTUDRAFT_336122 [Aspergillus tubingensis CBS 134.48]
MSTELRGHVEFIEYITHLFIILLGLSLQGPWNHINWGSWYFLPCSTCMLPFRFISLMAPFFHIQCLVLFAILPSSRSFLAYRSIFKH